MIYGDEERGTVDSRSSNRREKTKAKKKIRISILQTLESPISKLEVSVKLFNILYRKTLNMKKTKKMKKRKKRSQIYKEKKVLLMLKLHLFKSKMIF